MAIIGELKADHPISEECVQKKLVEPWVMGYETDLDLELQEAVREKKSDFKYSDLRAVRRLIDEQAAGRAITGKLALPTLQHRVI